MSNINKVLVQIISISIVSKNNNKKNKKQVQYNHLNSVTNFHCRGVSTVEFYSFRLCVIPLSILMISSLSYGLILNGLLLDLDNL